MKKWGVFFMAAALALTFAVGAQAKTYEYVNSYFGMVYGAGGLMAAEDKVTSSAWYVTTANDNGWSNGARWYGVSSVTNAGALSWAVAENDYQSGYFVNCPMDGNRRCLIRLSNANTGKGDPSDGLYKTYVRTRDSDGTVSGWAGPFTDTIGGGAAAAAPAELVGTPYAPSGTYAYTATYDRDGGNANPFFSWYAATTFTTAYYSDSNVTDPVNGPSIWYRVTVYADAGDGAKGSEITWDWYLVGIGGSGAAGEFGLTASDFYTAPALSSNNGGHDPGSCWPNAVAGASPWSNQAGLCVPKEDRQIASLPGGDYVFTTRLWKSDNTGAAYPESDPLAFTINRSGLSFERKTAAGANFEAGPEK